MLTSIDAILAAPPDISWNTIRLHFSGLALDVRNRLEGLVVDELGTQEDYGIITVAEAPDATLKAPEVGVDATTLEVGQAITSIRVVTDIAEIHGNGTLVARLEYPQAIAFRTDRDIILLDKETWFSEMLPIKRGPELDELIYDDAPSWEDSPEEDPTTHYDYWTQIQEL